MQQDNASSGAGSGGDRCGQGLTRREALAGGGLLIGSVLLSGCGGGGGRPAVMPGAYWRPSNDDTVTIESKPTTEPVVPPKGVIQAHDFELPPGIVPRTQWTRAGVSQWVEHYPLNGVRRITVHHDGMPPVGLSGSRQVAARIEQIRQSHVLGRGWADIGYHYVIDPTGRVWEGRSTRWQGAHVKDQNENNLGILVLGNFDVQAPTPSAVSSLDRFLASQMQRYNVPLTAVKTHQERAATDCPGRSLQAYMVRTRTVGGMLYATSGRAGLVRG